MRLIRTSGSTAVGAARRPTGCKRALKQRFEFGPTSGRGQAALVLDFGATSDHVNALLKQMNDASIERTEKEAPIEIVDYDPGWPARFDAEQVLLEAVLRPWLAGPIEHIGSTAMPGMPAKPVIDIMAPVRSIEASRPAIPAVARLNYVYFPYRAEIMHWFCKPSAAFRTHHLHLVPLGSPRWDDCLAFRDAIRSSVDLANEYSALKRRLAAEFKFDREAYTEGKSPFVQRVLSARA